MTHDSGFGCKYLRFLLCSGHSTKIVSDATNVHGMKLLLSADCPMPDANAASTQILLLLLKGLSRVGTSSPAKIADPLACHPNVFQPKRLRPWQVQLMEVATRSCSFRCFSIQHLLSKSTNPRTAISGSTSDAMLHTCPSLIFSV